MLYLDAQIKFIDCLSTYCSSDTIDYYKNCFHTYSTFLKKEFDLSFYDMNDVDKDLIFNYINYLRYINLKNVSIRTYVRGIRSFYNWAYREGICYFKFDRSIKLPRVDSEYKLPLTTEEVKKLLNYIDSSSDDLIFTRDRAIIYLMIQSGLRLQEVVNLKRDDICNGTITVRNSKYNKTRVIPLTALGFRLIDEYLDRSFEPFCEYLFLKSDFTHITKNTIKQRFKKYKKIIPRIHPHLLRHTFATSYIMGGGNLEILRCLLGHSTYTVTQGYVAKAAELSISNYPINAVEEEYFEVFSYRYKKTEPVTVPSTFAETSGIRTPDNLIKRKGV